jgi:hypothetical protein
LWRIKKILSDGVYSFYSKDEYDKLTTTITRRKGFYENY